MKKDTYCCDMRGMLSFLILFLLSKKERSGKEITDEIEKRKGDRPSPGTIYPALGNLKNEGLIKERKEGKAIIYHITGDGEKSLKQARQQFCRTFMDVF